MKKNQQQTKPKEQNFEQAFQEYNEYLGQLLMFLQNNSLLSLERKAFYQAALIKGYMSDELMEEMFAEIQEGIESLQGDMQALQQEIEKDEQKLQDIQLNYLAELQQLRLFKAQLRKAILHDTEQKIQDYQQGQDAEQIESIRQSLQ